MLTLSDRFSRLEQGLLSILEGHCHNIARLSGFPRARSKKKKTHNFTPAHQSVIIAITDDRQTACTMVMPFFIPGPDITIYL